MTMDKILKVEQSSPSITTRHSSSKLGSALAVLRAHTVNDYARYIGAPELHPLVSVIHYDELEHCRHSLNNYDVYALFIGDEELEELS